jgi:hypothetical protein
MAAGERARHEGMREEIKTQDVIECHVHTIHSQQGEEGLSNIYKFQEIFLV